MEGELQGLEREARANPGDAAALQAAHRAFRRAGAFLPGDLLARSEAWSELSALVARWFTRPLGTLWAHADGQLAAAEERLGRRLPWILREWYALTGARAGIGHSRAGGAWILGPKQLALADGWLLVGDSRSGFGLRFGIDPDDLGLDDPPVQRRVVAQGRELPGGREQRSERASQASSLRQGLLDLVRTRLVEAERLAGERASVTRTRPLAISRPPPLPRLGTSWTVPGLAIHGEEGLLLRPAMPGGLPSTNRAVACNKEALRGVTWWPGSPPARRPSSPQSSRPASAPFNPVNHHRWFIKRQGGPKSAEDYD